MLIFLFFIYSLACLVWCQEGWANYFSTQAKKNNLLNLSVVFLFFFPLNLYFFWRQNYFFEIYLPLMAIIGFLVSSLKKTYQDFFLVHLPVLVFLFFGWFFFLRSFWHALPDQENIKRVEEAILLLVYSALFVLYLYRTEEKTGMAPTSKKIYEPRIFIALFLSGGSFVFLSAEFSGWLALGALSSFPLHPFFYWVSIVLIQEIFTKIGIFKTFFNLVGHPSFLVRILGTTLAQGLLMGLMFYSFSAFFVGLMLGLTSSFLFSFGNFFLSLFYHSLVFLLSFLFFSTPL